MKVIQLNLNHCEVAQDLLQQSVQEMEVDVAILCEQYRNVDMRNWVSDGSNRAAIWVCGSHSLQEIGGTTVSGFVRVKVNDVHIYSCYAPPSASIGEFKTFLDRLTDDAQSHIPVLIAGDFNAWAIEWGSRETNSRGTALLEAFACLPVVLVNTGNTPTFCRGNASSIIDLTFMSNCLIDRGVVWRVSDIYTHSDHQALVYELAERRPRRSLARYHKEAIGWKSKAFDENIFHLMMEDPRLSGTANNKAVHLMKHITKACDAAMPRRVVDNRRKPVFWWNDEISELRKKCLKARRQYQRSRHIENLALRQRYCEARSKLKHAIKLSKRMCFRELCEEVDRDPWGRPYLTVMKKFRNNRTTVPTCPVILFDIVSHLFPKQPDCVLEISENEEENVPPVTEEEVLKACSRVGNNKAPGPDNVPNIALKSAVKAFPSIFTEVYTGCLVEGIFPTKWKEQKLVLLPKGDKPPEEPSSYRPICLLDTAGKILERIICDRLQEAIVRAGNLAEHQYGFRKARSTLDAIKYVVDTAQEAISGSRWLRGSKKYCAVVTLDVKNAFNTANWTCIFNALTRMEVPKYLLTVVASYFNERILIYNTDEGKKTYEVTGGVPQGSVLGPTLWNVMYDGILRLAIPSEARIVGFADDIAIVVVAKHKEEIVEICNRTVRLIQRWLSSAGLQLAEHKTEAVLITGRKIIENITLEIGVQQIVSQPYIRYLGVMIDCRLSYKTHLITSSKKASRVNAALSRIMPNTRGARMSSRVLLANVVNSIMMYGAPIWASSLERETFKQRVAAVQRLSALRVLCAFRTVSDDAACVLAGMPPIDLLAKERKTIYLHRNQGTKMENYRVARAETMHLWQRRWNESTKGRWTHRIINSIETWVNRQHGELDYHLTQFLTGHGCFRAYLYRFKHEESADCPLCIGIPEDAEHVVFECPRFTEERNNICSPGVLVPENILEFMLASEVGWDAVRSNITRIMSKLRRLERGRNTERS